VSGRSPARLLAPAALVATFLALFIVIGTGGGGDDEAPVDSGGNQPAATTPTKQSKSSDSKKSSSSSKRYTVKPGDTPSSIAEKAGMPLERLLELNPDIDPQALSPGQKLKLE
jgi:LysM repeat protein